MRRAVMDGANDVLVSAASSWEISLKASLGTVEAPDDLMGNLTQLGITELPITVDDGVVAGSLPRHHDDPFDRMLIAQAVRRGLVVLTVDRRFVDDDVPLL